MVASGTPSERESRPFDPFVERELLRLTTVYATPWRCEVDLLDRLCYPPADYLRLGRLARFYQVSQHQLPRVLLREHLDPRDLGFDRWRDGSRVAGARVWLFVLPSGQALAALSLDVATSLVASIPLLEDLYYGSATVREESFEQVAGRLADERLDCLRWGGEFLPERHQLVFFAVPEPAVVPAEDVLQRVIYRADLPYRPQFSAIRYPAELNHRPTTVAALGPYVSVVGGQQDYIENTVFLSGVQAVGTAAQLRDIRERSYECVRTFRAGATRLQSTRERRLILENLADRLGELELDLSFSVEATADLGLLVPALRLEGFHEALYESMSVARRAETTGHMLSRLRNAIAAELTAVQSVEERADERRRVRTAAAVTLVTTVAGTFGLLFGFFGINAAQVRPERSIFDNRYAGIYLLIVGLIVTAGVVYLGLHAYERRQTQRDRQWLQYHRAGSLRPAGVNAPERIAVSARMRPRRNDTGRGARRTGRPSSSGCLSQFLGGSR